jgi:hypothetical protein
MAQNYSPKIVQDSLVMCLDASQNKSYPTTDLPVKAGLLLWLDAADDSTFSYSSGTEVSQWRDKSGNNFHANQATTAQQPSRSTVVNSRKSVNFTSANGDFMRVNSGMVFTNSVTAIVFIKPGTQNNAYANILDQDHGMDGANGWVIQRNNVSSDWLSWVANTAGNDWFNPNQVSYTDNTSQIVTLRKGSSTLTLYSNGTSSGDVAVANQQIRQANYFGLNIGYWRAGAGRFYNGEICEIVVYNRALSLTELNQVHTYLGQKWSVSNTDRSVFDLAGNDDNGLFGNGTVANMPVYDFYNKGALKFDGSADYVTTATSGIVPTSAAPYTVSVWCYRNTNNLSYRELLSQWRSVNSGNSFYFGFENSNVRFTDNWNPVTVAGAGNTNVWMNLVGVYTVSNAFIYLNGVLAATKGSGFTYTGTGPLIIGRQGELNGEYFDGNIGNVLVYQKALSATEVAQNYEAQKSKFADTIVQQGLVLNVDAGNPYSYAVAGTTWYDTSGAVNDFTLVNSPIFSANQFILNGSTQYFSINAASGFFISSTNNFYADVGYAWTICVWFKFPVSPTTVRNSTVNGGNCSYSMIGNAGGIGGAETLSLFVSGGDSSTSAGGLAPYFCVVGVRGSKTQLSAGSVNTNTWNHVIVTWNGSAGRGYFNGVDKGALNIGANGMQVSGYTIGATAGGASSHVFEGSLSQVFVYNRALSSTEALQNYNATKGQFGL